MIHPQHFLIPEISETLKVSLTKFFGTVRQKIFHGKLRYFLPPPSPLSINFCATRKFWSTAEKGSCTKRFGTARQNNSDGKSWFRPLSYLKLFSIPEINETLKDFPTKNFSTMRHKRSDGKSWYSCPNPYQAFRYCETKKVRQKTWHNPLKHIKLFETRKKWHTKRFPYEVFRHSETKSFDKKSWYSLPPLPIILSKKFLDTRNFLKHRKDSLRWDKTILR